MFTHILVTLDGSEYAERALSHLGSLATVERARMILLRIVPPMTLAAAPADAPRNDPRVETALAYLELHANALRSAGVADVTTEVRFGDPALVIVEAARASAADLIVMSTRGLGADGSYALGSVALKVLMSAPCPVLLVRINRPEPPRSAAEERWQAEGGANVG